MRRLSVSYLDLLDNVLQQQRMSMTKDFGILFLVCNSYLWIRTSKLDKLFFGLL